MNATMTQEQEQIYTVNEVAAILRVSRNTVRLMIAEGDLEAFKVRSDWRIKQSALDAIMNKRKEKKP